MLANSKFQNLLILSATEKNGTATHYIVFLDKTIKGLHKPTSEHY